MRVQIDVIAPDDLSAESAAALAARLCRANGLQPEAVRLLPAALLKSFQPSDRWPDVAPLEAYAQAAKACFPAAQIGGGMYTSFTELNRKRPSDGALDFIGHLTCPTIHAADDRSVMQTLEALPHIARSVRRLWPTLAYRLGPTTIAPRRNPYGASTARNPRLERLPLADRDPRHGAAFGAAWLVGYAARVATESVEVLTLLESHGPNGPFGARATADAPPGPSDPVVPAWAALRALAAGRGAQLIRLEGLTDALAGLAWTHDGQRAHVLLANCTHEPVTVSGLTGDPVRVLQAHEVMSGTVDLERPPDPGS